MTAPADCSALEILGELPTPRLTRVLARCRVATFAPGDTILRLGTANHDLHFVLSGHVHVLFDVADRSLPFGIEAGRMFGEMSVIDELPVSATVIAAEQSRILLLPAEVFWSDVVTAPGIAHALMRTLSTRVRRDTAALMRTMQERIHNEALERELRLARDIQMGMLRHSTPWFPDRGDFAIAARLEPAKLVGGDFFDAFLRDPNHLVLAIGDVAGKGVSAAMFMVRAVTMLHSAQGACPSLASTAEHVNHSLADDNEASMFLTLFMAELDLRTGELEYINYGHLPPLVRSADGSVACHAVPPGVVFGLLDDAAGATGRLALPPGATLVLYSDGITEARDSQDQEFGQDRLLDAVARANTADPQEIIGRIAEAVTGHAGAVDQADDITLLAVTFLGPG